MKQSTAQFYLYWMREDFQGFDDLLRCTDDPELALDNFIYAWHQGEQNCPYCESTEIMKYKKYDFFKCKKCRRQFRARTNTLFHNSPLTYRQVLIGTYLVMGKNISARELAKEMKVSAISGQAFIKKIREFWNV